jgi:uncharacterized membrane protein SirB2
MNAVKVVGAAPPVEHCVLLLSSVMLMRHSSFVCLLVLEVWFGENKANTCGPATRAAVDVDVAIGAILQTEKRAKRHAVFFVLLGNG